MSTRQTKTVENPATSTIHRGKNVRNSTYSVKTPPNHAVSSLLPDVPAWVEEKLAPVEMAPQRARYCIVRTLCARFFDGHATFSHEALPHVLSEDNAKGLKELARLGVIRVWLNGNSREFEVVG